MQARVYVTLKPGVLDPQGNAVRGSLEALGFSKVQDVRLGKYLEIELAETDPMAARASVEEMCRRLLVNPVVESFRVDVPGTP